MIFGGVVVVVLVFGSLLVYVDNMLFFGILINFLFCVINGGSMIDVFFGENLGVNKIDGINYI